MLDRIITVRVDRITRHTDDVLAFEFVHPAGRTLPGYEAGAHVDVYLPGGFMRPYSLAHAAQAPAPQRYIIGVKREAQSRGGSASLHERVHVGDLLAVGSPRHTFALAAGARHHLLLAGGIGLTPLLAMAQQLHREGGSFTLCVFARSRSQLAFADAVAALAPQVRLHLDDTDAPQKLSIPQLLAEHQASGSHVYLCGPAGFMRAVLDAAAAWPEHRVHLEYFAPPEPAADAGSDEPFLLRLAGRNVELPVAADQSAVDALHDIGIDVPTSCEQGVCGTCTVRWIAADTDEGGGEPEHRDHCLSITERRSKVALCCARAKGRRLTIAL